MIFAARNLLLGLLLGAAYLAMLWGAVRLLVSHPRGPMLYGLLAPVRLALLAAGFALILRQGGAVAGLLAAAGLVAVRGVATRLLRMPAPGPAGRP